MGILKRIYDLVKKNLLYYYFLGGFITKKDLDSYRSIIDDTPLVNDHFNQRTSSSSSASLVMCGPKPSSSFAVTQLIVSVVASRKFSLGFKNENKFLKNKFIEMERVIY